MRLLGTAPLEVLNKALWALISTLAVSCVGYCSWRNYQWPYETQKAVLHHVPAFVRGLDSVAETIVFSWFIPLGLALLLVAGLSLSSRFSRGRLLMNLAVTGLLFSGLVYCVSLVFSGFD